MLFIFFVCSTRDVFFFWTFFFLFWDNWRPSRNTKVSHLLETRDLVPFFFFFVYLFYWKNLSFFFFFDRDGAGKFGDCSSYQGGEYFIYTLYVAIWALASWCASDYVQVQTSFFFFLVRVSHASLQKLTPTHNPKTMEIKTQ